MKTFMTILILIGLLLYISELSVSFKPFSVSFPYWYRGLGILLVAIGFLICNTGDRSKAYKDGLKYGSEFTIKTLKEMANKELDELGKDANMSKDEYIIEAFEWLGNHIESRDAFSEEYEIEDLE